MQSWLLLFNILAECPCGSPVRIILGTNIGNPHKIKNFICISIFILTLSIIIISMITIFSYIKAKIP